MVKNKKLLVLLSMVLIPTMVFASSNSEIPLGVAIFMEAFVSLHMYFFFIKPFSKMVAKDPDSKLARNLFITRCIILLIGDFITPSVCLIDFFMVFIGAFIIVPITALITKDKNNTNITNVSVDSIIENKVMNNNVKQDSNIILKCKNCGAVLKVDDNFCTNCGTAFEGDNVVVEAASSDTIGSYSGAVAANDNGKVYVKVSDFDSIYMNSDATIVDEFIKRALDKCGVEVNTKLIPRDILKRKRIMFIIFIALLFVYIGMIFFHLPIYTYVIGFIVLLIFFSKMNKYDFMKYLKKKIMERPEEKVTNIVMEAKESMVENNDGMFKLLLSLGCIVGVLLLFMKPHVIYEINGEGYGVRFYTFGVTNFADVVIPDEYKGKPVVSIRGDVFSNMYFLKRVVLPNSITEIRGQAFKNDYSLEEINIPNKLEYLGGGTFYNCSSLKTVILPDTLTEMGGEVFYKATSLETVILSNNLVEIRGNSFEECTSLKSIFIPDKVSRIGAHAFYHNINLTTVTLTENSQLKEIGSSAFRDCYSLKSIIIPANVMVNERAFKNSGTEVLTFEDIINNNQL